MTVSVTGPCEFLVMYDANVILEVIPPVTGPCEFLVMYDINTVITSSSRLQDPVNF